jgi:hypothetical protein
LTNDFLKKAFINETILQPARSRGGRPCAVPTLTQAAQDFIPECSIIEQMHVVREQEKRKGQAKAAQKLMRCAC